MYGQGVGIRVYQRGAQALAIASYFSMGQFGLALLCGHLIKMAVFGGEWYPFGQIAMVLIMFRECKRLFSF